MFYRVRIAAANFEVSVDEAAAQSPRPTLGQLQLYYSQGGQLKETAATTASVY